MAEMVLARDRRTMAPRVAWEQGKGVQAGEKLQLARG